MNLNQVTVPAGDIERSTQFYIDLGLNLIVKSPHYARFLCPDGESTFSIHLVEELTSGPRVWVYFECTDLDDKVNKLLAKGFIFHELPTDKTWLWREARLKDPDGNQIILFYAGDNRIHPPWQIAD